MAFLSNEDKETWENYKLNMHKLRFDPKKININSNIKNELQSSIIKKAAQFDRDAKNSKK